MRPGTTIVLAVLLVAHLRRRAAPVRRSSPGAPRPVRMMRPVDVLNSAPVNLATIIDPHPDDAVALISRGRTTTYGELRAPGRRRCGAGWSGSASSPVTGSAILCANNWYFVVSYLGRARRRARRRARSTR